MNIHITYIQTNIHQTRTCVQKNLSDIRMCKFSDSGYNVHYLCDGSKRDLHEATAEKWIAF